MTVKGTVLLLRKNISFISEFLISADNAHVRYRLTEVLTEDVCVISPGVLEGTYRFVYS